MQHTATTTATATTRGKPAVAREHSIATRTVLESSIPSGFYMTAYTLIVERRICNCCGAVYVCPATQLRISLFNAKGSMITARVDSLDIWYKKLTDLLGDTFPAPNLPYNVMEVDVPMQQCLTCLESGQSDSGSGSGSGQTNMERFQAAQGKTKGATHGQILTQNQLIVAIQLAEARQFESITAFQKELEAEREAKVDNVKKTKEPITPLSASDFT